MVPVARQNLWHDRVKALMSVGGVVLSVFLIFTMYGVYRGINGVMEDMVFGTGADLWITQEGTSGSVHSPSVLPAGIGARLAGIAGVAEHAPLIRTAVSYRDGGGETALLFLNGYRTTGSLGGPWSVVAGKRSPGPGEVLLDRSFAGRQGLRIGGRITLRGQQYQIAGLTERTNMMVGFFVFLRYQDAARFLPAGLTNSHLVRLQPRAGAAEVRARILQRLEGVSVRTSRQIAAAYKEEVVGSFLPILLVLSLVALVVGVLVVGLLIYMLTVEKSREYGIIKAMGGTNAQLYRIVLSQSLIVSVGGYVLGAATSFPLMALIRSAVPEFLAVLDPRLVLMGLPLFVLTGIAASLIPVRRIAGIDPAVVFKR